GGRDRRRAGAGSKRRGRGAPVRRSRRSRRGGCRCRAAGRRRAPRPGLHQLRRVPRLRGARRAVPRAGEGARAVSALSLSRTGARRRTRAQPVEYSLLLTATLCLLAFGAVMVFSASSTTSLLGTTGDSAYYLKRTLAFGAIGLLVMRALAGRGRTAVRSLTPLLLLCSIAGLLVVLLPGIGVTVNGAQRWLGVGPLQVQPSEIAKLALILYGAHLLAHRPRTVTSVRATAPYLLVVAFACALLVAEPDLGTAIVACVAATAMLVTAGARLRSLALLAVAIGGVTLLMVLIEPYRMARLTGFLHPTSDPSSVGYQAIQAK